MVSRYGLHRFYAHWRIHGSDSTLDSPVCAAAAQSRRMCARGDSPRTAPARRVRRAGVDSLHGAQRWVQAVFAAPCPNETPHPLQRLAAPPVSRAAHRIDTAGTSKHTLFRAFTVLADCPAGAFCKVQKCDSFEGWTYVCGMCMPCAACGCDAHSTSGSCPTERCPGSPFLVRRGRPLRSLPSLPALRAPSRTLANARMRPRAHARMLLSHPVCLRGLVLPTHLLPLIRRMGGSACESSKGPFMRQPARSRGRATFASQSSRSAAPGSGWGRFVLPRVCSLCPQRCSHPTWTTIRVCATFPTRSGLRRGR